MRTNVRIARVAGIEIGVNWTWLIVFGLVVWSLGARVFPAEEPGLARVTYWAMAAVAALVFFAAILLHELGHSLVARREGVEIEEITLWLLGGVARLRGQMASPGGEFRIAVAGPLVSLAIAVILLLVAAFLPLPPAYDATIFWIGYINAFVLVFNLLPALPLDGGRILHSALWGGRRDLVWATRVGTAIARGVAWLLVGGGIALFVFGVAEGGIWLAFIGWFLDVAARAEERQVLAEARLEGLRVRDLMVARPVTVEADQTIGQVMDEVAHLHRHSSYPVLAAGRPVGLLPFRCVAKTPRGAWDERLVRDCMLPREEVPTVPEDESAADALQELAQNDVRRALVVDDGHLAGLLSLADLMRMAQRRSARR